MSLGLELSTAFRSAEGREISRVADVFIARNNDIEVLKDQKVTVNYIAADFATVEIQNRLFPISRNKQESLFAEFKKFTTEEAIMLPAMIAYAGLSTFYNIQTVFNVEQLFTISNAFLAIVIFIISAMWGADRAKAQVSVLFIKQQLRAYEQLDVATLPHIVKQQYISKGYTGTELIGVFFVGFLSVIPFAVYFSTPIDYLVTYVDILVLIAILTGKLFQSKDATEMKQGVKIFAPAVVEAVFDTAQQHKTYRPLGVLVNIQGKNDAARNEFKKKLEQKYKDKILVGFKSVYENKNVLYTPEVTFQTLLAESYREYDFQEEKSFAVVSAEQTKKVLAKNLEFILPEKLLTELQEHFSKYQELHIIKDFVIAYDTLTRQLINALAYLIQENKTRTEMSIADKTTIEHLNGAYSSAVIFNNKLESFKDNHNTEKLYRNIAWVGVGIFVVLLLIWGVNAGWIN